VALGDALLGPEDLREVRQLHDAAADVDLGVVHVARDVDGCRHARRRLGARAPRGVMVARGRRRVRWLGGGGRAARRAAARATRAAGGARRAATRGGAAGHQRSGALRGGRGPWRTAPATGTYSSSTS